MKIRLALFFQVLITKGAGIKNSVQRGWYYWAKDVIYLGNLQMKRILCDSHARCTNKLQCLLQDSAQVTAKI